MLFLIISIFLFTIELLIGYVVPMFFTIEAIQQKNESKIFRWIVHFFYIGILNSTILKALNYLEFDCVRMFIGGIASGVIFMLAKTNKLMQPIDIGNGKAGPLKDQLRQVIKTGLIALNLY